MKLLESFSDWLSFKSERFPTVLLVLGYILLIGGCLASFSSCNTERKATNYFNSHKPKAAKYCSETFPLKPETIVEFIQVDSSGYNEAYMELLTYADSILQSKRDTTRIIVGDTVYYYIKTDTAKIRKEVERKLRQSLKPCIDSVVHIRERVVDSAKVFYLNSEIATREQINKELRDKLGNRTGQRNWLFIIVIILLVWTFRKPLLSILKIV